jgi:hypothetical protein
MTKRKRAGKAMTATQMRERFDLRVDAEFFAALDEFRRLYEDLPSKSEAMRRALMLALDTKRREHKGKH